VPLPVPVPHGLGDLHDRRGSGRFRSVRVQISEVTHGNYLQSGCDSLRKRFLKG